MLFRREAFRQLKRGLGPMPGVRALPLSAPKGRPLPRGGLFPRRRGAASGQGRGPVKAFRGATDASISQKRFLRLALGRTAVSGFSTKKAISRLRRPFAADDGAQNRRFEQASDGRHGKARSFFVCGDAAAAPEDGASDHGLALFRISVENSVRPKKEWQGVPLRRQTRKRRKDFLLHCPSGWLCVACAPTVCGVFYSCPAPFNSYRIIPTL